MMMPGRKYSALGQPYRYSINGQESTPEITPNSTTAEFWQYDARIARRWNVDPRPDIAVSPYATFRNNPMYFMDARGDTVWSTKKTEVDKNGNITETINIEGEVAVLDNSDALNAPALASKKFQNHLNNQLSRTISEAAPGPDGKNIIIKRIIRSNIKVRLVQSMNEVQGSDHLMVLVDRVNGKSAKGGAAGGIASTGGKVAYVATGWVEVGYIINSMVHEFSHNLTLRHTFDDGEDLDDTEKNDPENYMSYTKRPRLKLTNDQVLQIVVAVQNNEVNNGVNFSSAPGDSSSWLWHNATNDEPWDGDIKKGMKIPLPIKNPKN